MRFRSSPNFFNRMSLLLVTTALSTVSGFAQGADPSTMTMTGTLPGGTYSYARGVSADGKVAVGSTNSSGPSAYAFRWTEAGGMESLGLLNAGTNSYANAASSDGSIIAGRANDGALGGATRAFRWTQATGMESLGVLNGGTFSAAYGISDDGTVIVGGATDGAQGNANRAFRWTQATGMESLGNLNGGVSSTANGISADGTTVVGFASDGAAGNVDRAYRWTQATGMENLGTMGGGNNSYARAVSADGSVVVGHGQNTALNMFNCAFRWTQGTGMVGLGGLNGGTSSYAYGVSADGSVVVGTASDGAASGQSRAFRWTQANGMQTVEAWLQANGVTVLASPTKEASGTSADGSVVVGTLWNDKTFFARVGSQGSGLVTMDDVQDSLADTAQAGQTVLTTSKLLINGAHSRPLSRRVAEGRMVGWVAGDWGQDDHGQRSGDVGLAELGLGRNFGRFQSQLSFGRMWGHQNMALSGRSDSEGNYALVENLIPLIGDVWLTVGGHYSWGHVDIRRGYLNAGGADFSSGKPDQNGWGLRARVDWENAFAVEKVAFAPFVDLSRTQARLDGYQETGGGFPAIFDARDEHATELRLGLGATRPVTQDVSVFATAEGTHRFEDKGAGMSGSVLGLSTFDYQGQKNKQYWARFAVGVEGAAAGGKASVSLNTTTQGEMPNYWLALGWQVAF